MNSSMWKILYIKLLLLLLMSPNLLQAQCKFEEKGKEKKQLVLENEFILLKVNPGKGGRITRLFFKPAQKELVYMASRSIAPQGAGLLLDCIPTKLWQKKYSWEVVENTVNRVAIRLSTETDTVKLRKTIELRKGRSNVFAVYEMSNKGKEPLLLNFRSTNILCPGGPTAPEREISFPYGHPAEKLIANVSSMTGKKSTYVYKLKSPNTYNHYILEPSRSWIGVREPNGLGIAVTTEFPYVDYLYSWFPSIGIGTGFPTAELFYRPVELRPFIDNKDEIIMDPGVLGNVFKQSIVFIPFTGLPRFDGCAGGIVAAIEFGKDTLKLSCTSDTLFKGTVKAGFRDLKSKNLSGTVGKTVELKPGKTTVVNILLSSTVKNKVAVVRFLNSTKQTVAEFERPLDKKVEKEYVQQPKQKRMPRALGSTPYWHPQKWEPTPHTKWADPYHKGPVKALCVVPARAISDLLELEQRIDAEIDYLPVRHPHVFAEPGEMGKCADPNSAFTHLLSKKGKYDAIILAGGMYWSRLPEKMQDMILERVKEGTGLLYISGMSTNNHPEKLKQILKGKPADPSLLERLSETISWDCVPKNKRSGIRQNYGKVPGLPSKELLKKMVSLSTYGKGRIAECLWNTWIGYKPYKSEGLVPHPIEEISIPTSHEYFFCHNLVGIQSNRRPAPCGAMERDAI